MTGLRSRAERAPGLTCTGGPELVSAAITLWVAICSAVALTGCPDTKQGGAPKVCATAYEQCVLPTGVLGVCDSVECADGQTPPCLVCRSQH